MKIATNTYRQQTGKPAFRVNWLGKVIYTEDYISWLIQNWNTAEEKVRVLKLDLLDVRLDKLIKKHRVKPGDDVLYLEKYLGFVTTNNTVKLKDGRVITTLKANPEHFRKIL